MTLNTELKDESSRFITYLLLSALKACRQGDVNLASRLGLSMELMGKLDSLKPDQVIKISGKYMSDYNLMDMFHIDSSKIGKILEEVSGENKRYEMIVEYLRRGACKMVMKELFGMHHKNVADLKRFHNIPSSKGRLRVTTIEEQREIYDAWLATIKISDRRERLIYVARHTNLPMSMIYREVQEIEKITNTQSLTRKSNCA